jgi:hypothetical protein
MRGSKLFSITSPDQSNPPVADPGSYRQDKMQALTTRDRQIALLATGPRQNGMPTSENFAWLRRIE